MCDKYKPTEEDIKDSNKFWKEYEKMQFEANNGKACCKPSLLKRICSAGTFARWWELALVWGIGYLVAKFPQEIVANAPVIIAPLVLLWLISFLKRFQ